MIAEWLDILKTQYSVSLAKEVQYRAANFIWMIGAVLEPLIFLVVWTVVAETQGGSVNGMTARDFAAYFIAAFFVGELTYSWLMWEYQKWVTEGSYSARLLRPVPPIIQDFGDNFGSKIVRMTIILPATAIMMIVFRPAVTWEWWSLLFFVPAIVLAMALFFLLDFGMALCAFWTTRVMALNRLYDTVLILLSGFFAPLELYPPAIVTLTWLLPFRWIIAFPIQLLLAQLTPQQAALGLLAQIGWLAAVGLVVSVVWRRAVLRFSAVGG
jgi:ABC-2 type transport system permease protein